MKARLQGVSEWVGMQWMVYTMGDVQRYSARNQQRGNAEAKSARKPTPNSHCDVAKSNIKHGARLVRDKAPELWPDYDVPRAGHLVGAFFAHLLRRLP